MKIKPSLLIVVIVTGLCLAGGTAFAFIASPSDFSVFSTTKSTSTPTVNLLKDPETVVEVKSNPSEEITTTISGSTVVITGPSLVKEKIEKCIYGYGWFGPGGNGLSIDWGDGTSSLEEGVQGKSCTSSERAHTYKKSATYVLHIVAWHPGPIDRPVTDWEGSTTIDLK